MIRCPICEKGKLIKVIKKHVLFGVDLGVYPGEKCTSCGEVFTDSSAMEKIEAIAKKKGIWGLSARTKITKTGNSLAVRIPKRIADYLKLKDGKEAHVHPEDHKLVIQSKP